MNNGFASPFQRIVALLFDLNVIFLPIMLVGIDIVLLAAWGKVPKTLSDIVPALSLVVSLVVTFFCFVLSQASRNRATIGQRIMRIYAADTEVKKMGFAKATLRFAPLGILLLVRPLFLRAEDLPSLAAGSVVHIAATVCWVTIVVCYLYCAIDPQKASVFDRLLSSRVYRDESAHHDTLPQVQILAALAFVFLGLLPMFKSIPLYGMPLLFLGVFAGLLVYGMHTTRTRDLGLYLRRVVAFQPVLLIALIPSFVLGGVTWGLVLYLSRKAS